jgi:cytochrome c oxidase assembly protein subunit 15
VLVAATLALILVGGMVTTHQAGMAYWTWPLSDGSVNPEGWIADMPKRLEHGHRLLATSVALLTAVVCTLLWRNWPAFLSGLVGGAVSGGICAALQVGGANTGVITVVTTVATFTLVLLLKSRLPTEETGPRWLALAAVWFVCAQAILGGLRVLVEAHVSPESAVTYRVFHGVVAQTFLVLVVILAARVSPVSRELLDRPALIDGGKIRGMAIAFVGIYFVQLVCAAILRHQPGGSAGLILSTWPRAQGDGSWLPLQWTGLVTVSFLHTRVLPLLLTGHVIGLAIRVAKSAPGEPRVRRLGWLLLGLLVLQFVLGVQVIWMPKPAARSHVINTHVINGALTLATAVLLAFRAGVLGPARRISR